MVRSGLGYINGGLSLTDEQLVMLSQSGDSEAQEILVRRHTGLVRGRARNFFIPGADREDVLQEGLLGLLKAIRDFRPSHGSYFKSFADLCVSRQIITAVKTATRRKHVALNQYKSLDETFDEDDGLTLVERLPAPVEVLDEDLEPHLQVLAEAQQLLSSYEFAVLKLYLQGLSYQEIGNRLGKGLKSVDSAVFKVKLKLRRRSAQVVA